MPWKWPQSFKYNKTILNFAEPKVFDCILFHGFPHLKDRNSIEMTAITALAHLPAVGSTHRRPLLVAVTLCFYLPNTKTKVYQWNPLLYIHDYIYIYILYIYVFFQDYVIIEVSLLHPKGEFKTVEYC